MEQLASFLIAKYFPESRDTLVVGGVPVTKLAEDYGTPFFAYDRAIVDLKYDALRSALPKRFSIYYSIKANPCPAVVRHFVSRGCGIEIASLGEFQRAEKAGCSPERMLFAGPGKTVAELQVVLSRSIGEIHVESLVEARRIARICRGMGRSAPVAIRINPAAEVEGGAMRMGGRPAPFGMDEEDLDQILDEILSLRELELCGIHLFIGTQIIDASMLIEQYGHAVGLARRVAGRIGHPLHTVDLGGGLGIPYFAHERELSLQHLHDGVERLCRQIEEDPLFGGTRFIVEPGRFLVGEAGVYVAQVTDIKISRGKKFLVLDGGMNHHLAASGNLGQTIKRNYPIAVANRLRAPAEEVVDLVGPLCTPLDTLGRGVRLPRTEIGDLVAILQSGAYARSASPLGFLSHSAPSEIWMDAEHAIYERGESSDALDVSERVER